MFKSESMHGFGALEMQKLMIFYSILNKERKIKIKNLLVVTVVVLSVVVVAVVVVVHMPHLTGQ